MNVQIDGIDARISVDIERNWKEQNKSCRVYFWHEKESILDNLQNRRARPYELYRQFLPGVAEALGVPKNTAFRWSQKAGCACGCSPGFLCSARKGVTVSVSLSSAAPAIGDPTLVRNLS